MTAVRDFTGIVFKAIRMRKVDFVAVVAFGFIGAAAQIGAIGALLGFLRMMSKTSAGGTITWRGIHLSNGFGALVFAAGVLAVMLALAAVANYLSVRRARAIGRGCTESAVLELIHLVDRADTMPEGLDTGALRMMGVRGSRLRGVSVENAIRLIHPFVQVLVLAASLFWLDAWATALLLPALLVPLPFLWRFNRRVRASAREFYDTAASGFGKAVGQAVDTLQHARLEHEILREATLETYHNTPEVESFFGCYDDMSLTSSRAILISSLFRPVILAYVLLLVGVQVSGGDMTWPDAIAFLIILLQMTARAEGLVAHFSVLARLFTQVEPFVRFAAHVGDSASDDSGGEHEASRSILFQGQGGQVACEPGRLVQVYTGKPCHKFGLSTLFSALEPSIGAGLGSLKGASFVGRRYRPCGSTGARLMTGQREPDDRALRALRVLATELGVAGEVESLLNQNLEAETFDEMSAGALAVLQVGSVLCSSERVLLLDIAVLTQLERPQAEALLEHLSDRLVILLAPDYRSSCNFAESVVVVEEEQVRWMGDRKAWNTSELRARLGTKNGSREVNEVDPTLEDELV